MTLTTSSLAGTQAYNACLWSIALAYAASAHPVGAQLTEAVAYALAVAASRQATPKETTG